MLSVSDLSFERYFERVFEPLSFYFGIVHHQRRSAVMGGGSSRIKPAIPVKTIAIPAQPGGSNIMTPTRKRRLVAVLVIVTGVGLAAVVAIRALNENMLFFVSPTDVKEQNLPAGKRFRLGGLVENGSLSRVNDSLMVGFDVTDGAASVAVVFDGILPDLFREGQGIIAIGELTPDGHFEASEVLAKHDENYMPPEVADALDRAGHPGAENGQ